MKNRKLRIRTTVGEVTLNAPYGQDPASGQWLFPVRVLWGLSPKEKLSPVLEEKLCYTAVETLSYERAAKLAGKWGVVVDDSTIQRHVQKKGGEAEAICEERVERALSVETRSAVIAEAGALAGREPFSLVIMLDGWMARERGAQWGRKPASAKASRVEWREMKSAIFFRAHDRAETQSGRRVILEKFYEAYRGEPYEFGRRVYAQALRRGLVQAERVFVVADGAVWIWNLVADRFSQATGVLDFYHASQHLWAVAQELHEDQDAARQWVEPLLHQLKHGGEAGVLKRLDELLELCAELSAAAADAIEREVRYFDNHRAHLHYQQVEGQGCPKGSGAMESTCSQFQDRFKRTGQFWSPPGKQHLMALQVADRNADWDEIWEINPEQT